MRRDAVCTMKALFRQIQFEETYRALDRWLCLMSIQR
jgi:hypothetical protein